ncbi:MAG: hypothetical protein GY898_07100 [Proteobacteria bacterium]|nr:hypothetical protein [Pseudomonadota bacterium]
MHRIACLAAALGLSGCFLAAPDDIVWGEAVDDDDATDDDDTVDPDDDDTVEPDDDDTAPPTDEDGDGFAWDIDCDDGDDTVYPGAEEVWDFRVNDCDIGLPLEVFSANSPSKGNFRGIEGTESWANFGVSWSLGDVNGDGAADLCTRHEGDGDLPNDVLIFSNILDLLATEEGRVRDWHATAHIHAPPGSGSVDCSEDLDGDGDTDLVFSSIDIGSGAGALALFLGNSGLGHGELEWEFADIHWASNDTEWLGSCFALGDFTPDAPGMEVATVANYDGEGAVALFPQTGYDPIAYGPRDLIGSFDEVTCTAIRDVTGDGYDELIVADWGTTTLYLSDDFEAVSEGIYLQPSYVFDGISARSGFGRDLTGDGLRELVLGAPDAANFHGHGSAGTTMVFFGDNSAVNWRFGLFDTGEPVPGRSFFIDGFAPDDRLGHRVCPLGDASRDGIADFVITAPGNGNGSARVFVGRSQEQWEKVAGSDGTIEAGFEDSLFQGRPVMPDLGFSYGRCGYDWRGEDSPAEHLWLMSRAIDEAGALAMWKNEAL